jgi:hypothetical protein
MPRFRELSDELQLKVRQMEQIANSKGKDSPECKKLWRELGKSEVACFALSQKDGVYKACLRAPTENSLEIHKSPRCATHGGLAPSHDSIPEESKLAKIKHLRPNANMIHGLYAEESNFIQSLTEGEIQFMAWLESKVRENYEVEEGLGDVVLEGLLHDAVLHFRLLNTGRLERGSKHTAKPLMDLMKACKEMGWTKKEQTSQNQTQSVLDKWLKKLDTMPTSNEEDNDEEDNFLN